MKLRISCLGNLEVAPAPGKVPVICRTYNDPDRFHNNMSCSIYLFPVLAARIRRTGTAKGHEHCWQLSSNAQLLSTPSVPRYGRSTLQTTKQPRWLTNPALWEILNPKANVPQAAVVKFPVFQKTQVPGAWYFWPRLSI
jgi:hypothetical protein